MLIFIQLIPLFSEISRHVQNTHVWHVHKDLSKRKRHRGLYRHPAISWVWLITILPVRTLFSRGFVGPSLLLSPSLLPLSPPPRLLLLYEGVLSWSSSEWSSSDCKLSSHTLRLQSLQCSVQTAVNVHICIILSQQQALNELLTLYKFLFLPHHKLYQQCESPPPLLSHTLVFFCLLPLCTVASVTVPSLIAHTYANLRKGSWSCTTQPSLLLPCRMLLSFPISSQFSLWDSSSLPSTVITTFNVQSWCLLTRMFSLYMIRSLPPK